MTAPALSFAGSATIGAQSLFEPLSLEIPSGQWTCLLGPSGIGKSTILRLIAGLETGATFDGVISASDGLPVQGRLALMAQTDMLMPWLNVTRNVMLGHHLRGDTGATDRAEELITRVGLADHVAKRPAQLSGGMRQRVALARTLMEDRPVILLDEPFSALDARTRAEMQELAAELLSDRTVLLVTHDPAEAVRLAHNINVLTEQGLTAMPAPDKPPVRAHDDPDAFACQTDLMDLIRTTA